MAGFEVIPEETAHGVNSFQIFGGPDWMNSYGYD
jgi:hypothetical protein